MRNNMYDIARTVYGSESTNMQPIAFGYVPESKRGSAQETRNSAQRNDQNRTNRDKNN